MSVNHLSFYSHKVNLLTYVIFVMDPHMNTLPTIHVLFHDFYWKTLSYTYICWKHKEAKPAKYTRNCLHSMVLYTERIAQKGCRNVCSVWIFSWFANELNFHHFWILIVEDLGKVKTTPCLYCRNIQYDMINEIICVFVISIVLLLCYICPD